MIRLLCAACLAAFVVLQPASAEPIDVPTVLTPQAIGAMSLDELFAKLPGNAKLPAGARIEQEILRRFARSGSPTADLLLTWATESLEKKEYRQALDVLDQIIVIKPDFAEAWNKRATVYFMMDDYGASLADIRQTLAREPRHFGALAGLGTILKAMDRKPEAIRALRRALEIDPRLEDVRKTLDRLEKETAGQDI